MMRLACLLLITVLLLSACEKDFDMPVNDGGKKMVVNCLLDNDNYIKVYLTESNSSVGNVQLKSIQNAVVELYRNDTLEQLLPYVSAGAASTYGRYQSAGFALPNSKYAVRVTHPEYGVVTTNDFLYPKPALISYSLLSYGDSSNNYKTTYQFRFKDTEPGLSYYRINVWHTWQSMTVNSQGDSVLSDFERGERLDVQASLQDTVRDYNISMLFSDRDFNGQSKDILMQFNSLNLQRVEHAQLFVMIAQISEAHYNYFKTIEAARSGLNPESAVYCNIDNGYGIMMSQSVNKMVTTLK